jgi:hypothetical protein
LLIIDPPGRSICQTDKCLAQSNKSSTKGKATKKRRGPPSSAAQFVQRQDPLSVSAAGLSPKPRERQDATCHSNKHTYDSRRMLHFGVRADIDRNCKDIGGGHYRDR